jgi:hypothetical protein
VSARKSPPKAEHRWRIIRLKSTPAADLGTVTPDEKSAIGELSEAGAGPNLFR